MGTKNSNVIADHRKLLVLLVLVTLFKFYPSIYLLFIYLFIYKGHRNRERETKGERESLYTWIFRAQMSAKARSPKFNTGSRTNTWVLAAKLLAPPPATSNVLSGNQH